jgi:hypothetical protein
VRAERERDPSILNNGKEKTKRAAESVAERACLHMKKPSSAVPLASLEMNSLNSRSAEQWTMAGLTRPFAGVPEGAGELLRSTVRASAMKV